MYVCMVYIWICVCILCKDNVMDFDVVINIVIGINMN